MSFKSDSQVKLIDPNFQYRRRIIAIVVVPIVIIGLLISVLNQPIIITENQEGGNVIRGLILIGQIAFSFIALLGAFAELTGISIRDLFSSRAAKTSIEEFPFYIFNDFDNLMDYLFPDPKAPLLPDRDIKYLPQISAETDSSFQRNGLILICGKSKTGKTREACELLRRWWHLGPTVLVTRSHVGLYPPFQIPENLPIRNLVLFFDDIDRYLGDHSALKRFDETVQYFQNICRDKGELRVVATVRQEEDFWGKIDYDPSLAPWNKFDLIQLKPLSSDKAQQAIKELSKMSDISINNSLIRIMAEKNDGTFLNLVLAFRGWLSKNIKAITPEHIKSFDGALKNTWRRRYEVLQASFPEVKPIYAAVDFLQYHSLPLRPSLVVMIATEFGMRKGTLSILGLFDRLQNWIDMSPLFNWYRNPQQRRRGWILILVIGIGVFYLLLYAFLRFTPL